MRTEMMCDTLQDLAKKMQKHNFYKSWDFVTLLAQTVARLRSLEGELAAARADVEWWKVESVSRTGTDGSAKPSRRKK